MGSGSGELDDTVAPAGELDATAAPDDRAGVAPSEAGPLPEVSPRRYRIDDEVGRGGLGRVLRARDVVLDRTVAVKELIGADEHARRRFVREAKITARLQHPSIVPVYEAGRWPDRAPFYAMKLVGGRPLHEVIAAASTLATRLALVPTVLAVADAIAYAHSERIVHRDLKPHNVLVGSFGETIVIDWGLAKDLAADDRDAPGATPYRAAAADETAAGALLGTPAYMAPEQVEGAEVDERADVYALGAMLYHVIAGRAPHEGRSLDDVLTRILAGEIAPLARVEPDTPADLAAIVGKAMARDPEARYPSARELADDLRRFTTGQLVGAHRYTLRERVGRWIRRHRAITAVTAAAVVVLAAFATWSFRRISDERDTAIARAHEAVDNGNRATLAQARGAIARDPAEALAWLARLDVDGPGWDVARVLAADALARPRLVEKLTGLRDWAGDWDVDPSGRVLIAAHEQRIDVIDLPRARVHSVAAPTDEIIWSICDDGAHAYGAGMIRDDSGDFEPHGPPLKIAYELDLTTGDLVTRPADGLDAWVARQACDDRDRFHTVDDRALLWWDAAARAPRVLVGEPFRAMYRAGDHRHAVTIGADGGLVWWDVDGGRRPFGASVPTEGGDGDVELSRDGRTVVFAGAAASWILRMGQRPIKREGSTAAAVSADGSQVALVTDDGIDLGIEDSTQPPLRTHGKVKSLRYSADDRWLVAIGDRTTVWDASYASALSLPETSVSFVEMWLGHDRLARWSYDGTLEVWAFAPPDLRARVPSLHSAISPNGRWLATGEHGVVRRIDLRDRRDEVGTPVSKWDIDSLAIDDDGTVLFENGDAEVWRWPAHAPAIHVADIPTYETQPTMSSSPRIGTYLATYEAIDVVEHGQLKPVWPAKGAPRRFQQAVSADLRWVAVVDPDDEAKTLRVVDRTTGQEAIVPDAVTAPAFSRDGRWFAAGARGGGAIILWETSARRARRIATPNVDVRELVFSPDDRELAIRSASMLAIVEIDRASVRTLLAGMGDLRAMRFDAEGERFAATSDDDAWLWDLATGEQRHLATGSGLDAVFDGDQIVLRTWNAVVDVPDDLPRDPRALASMLRGLPYELDARGAVRIRR